MAKNDGGPAFPCPIEDATQCGMSLRDWFAGMALQGIVIHAHYIDDMAKTSYEVADAMIAERDKEADNG